MVVRPTEVPAFRHSTVTAPDVCPFFARRAALRVPRQSAGVQEVRARPEDIPPAARRPPGWHTAFTVAERRGYSGVSLYSKLQPVRVETSLGVPRFDREGRFMAGHFQTARGRFVVVNGYFSKGSGPARDNSRVGYKLDFSRTVFTRAQALRRRGPVLVIGDYNTAHRVIDLARPQANVTHSGFLPEERAELDRWIDAGWVDAFRALHPEAPDQYTWWRRGSGAVPALRGHPARHRARTERLTAGSGRPRNIFVRSIFCLEPSSWWRCRIPPRATTAYYVSRSVSRADSRMAVHSETIMSTTVAILEES